MALAGIRDAGFPNLGNTCYASACLAVLLRLDVVMGTAIVMLETGGRRKLQLLDCLVKVAQHAATGHGCANMHPIMQVRAHAGVMFLGADECCYEAGKGC